MNTENAPEGDSFLVDVGQWGVIQRQETHMSASKDFCNGKRDAGLLSHHEDLHFG